MLPKNYLKSNAFNRVNIVFETDYVNNSQGLHKFVDPSDNEVYLYTNLEPFCCHKVFPCFDQPCIRAPLFLTVISPDSKWEIISNESCNKKIRVNSEDGKNYISSNDFEEIINKLDI